MAEQVTELLLTCESVLYETAFHLGDTNIVFAMIEEELVRISFDCNTHLPQLAALARRYRGSQTKAGRSLPHPHE